MFKTIDHFIAKIKNNKEGREPTCVHDPSPNCRDTTLIKSPKRTMVHPCEEDYFCAVCHKTFKFVKDGNVFTLVKEND